MASESITWTNAYPGWLPGHEIITCNYFLDDRSPKDALAAALATLYVGWIATHIATPLEGSRK